MKEFHRVLNEDYKKNTPLNGGMVKTLVYQKGLDYIRKILDEN